MNKLLEIASVFFRMGCIAFGGPAVHIAMMDEEIVQKRKWMSREHFLDLIGATNLIPGPNSTEMVMHCGHERGGFWGLIVAGTCFILPAVVITGALAWLYTTYGQLPQVEPFLYGIKPAVLAIIAGAILKLGKKAIKTWELGLLGFLALIITYFGINEILVILGTGLLGIIYFQTKNSLNTFIPFLAIGGITTKATTTTVFWTFLKVGAVLYGSGYVLFAYLDNELVANGWLTRQELIDAIAIGQFTPGPVLSTATFIGYQLAGFWGAVLATIGIFLPSFVFVLILNPLIPKMRNSKPLSYFLDSVNVGAVAIMVMVLITMCLETLKIDILRDVLHLDWRALIIAIISAVLTFSNKKVNVAWIILGGAVFGYILLRV